jgi:hypothetical protein
MKKIIISGTFRSGTTALATLMSLDPKILVMDEVGIYHIDSQKYQKRKCKLKNITNTKALKGKNLIEKDIDDFFLGDFTNKGKIEFLGDKFPEYCGGVDICNHLVKKHPDSYFIFTYRNPCASIYSRIKRCKFELGHTQQLDHDCYKHPWYFKNLEVSVNELIKQTENWYKLIYPNIKNKFIINYDDYVNKVDLLIKDLSVFLGVTIDIDCPETQIGHNELFDNGKRGLYVNLNPFEYENELTRGEIAYILEKTSAMDKHVKSLIKAQRAI